jgi:hypothetical protein
MALDDHSLADIGVQRSQVRDLCDGFYAPAPSAATAPARRPETSSRREPSNEPPIPSSLPRARA